MEKKLLNAYLNNVRVLVKLVSGKLSGEELSEVTHLIDHGEPAEGLRTLAWIIVEGNKKVPLAAISQIRELTSGLILDSDMPENIELYSE